MNGIYSTQAAEASYPSANDNSDSHFFRRIICCSYENSVLAKTHHAPCPPHPKTHSASPVGDNTPPWIKHHSQAPTSARTSRDWRKRGGRRRNKVKSSHHLPTTHNRKGHDRAANTLLLILQTYGMKDRVDSLVTPVSTSQGQSTWQVRCVFSTDCLLALRLPLLW